MEKFKNRPAFKLQELSAGGCLNLKKNPKVGHLDVVLIREDCVYVIHNQEAELLLTYNKNFVIFVIFLITLKKNKHWRVYKNIYDQSQTT